MIYGNYLREKYNNTAVKLADAEGVPCVMEYSKGKNLRNYEIYGNSVQDGTPTPDTPIEIQSVGDLVTDTASEYYGKYDIHITVAGTSSETKHIYLNEPLRKVGDYADYIDFKNKKVVRNVGETTFNGSETWVKTGDTLDGVYQGFAVSNSVYNIPKGTNLICLSDKFPYASGKAANIVTIGYSSYGLRIIIGTEYVSDLDITTFKTWLSANNVKIIYPIATPTEESISLPALKTFKGTSIMSVNTTIQPSNIKTKYVRL